MVGNGNWRLVVNGGYLYNYCSTSEGGLHNSHIKARKSLQTPSALWKLITINIMTL